MNFETAKNWTSAHFTRQFILWISSVYGLLVLSALPKTVEMMYNEWSWVRASVRPWTACGIIQFWLQWVDSGSSSLLQQEPRAYSTSTCSNHGSEYLRGDGSAVSDVWRAHLGLCGPPGAITSLTHHQTGHTGGVTRQQVVCESISISHTEEGETDLPSLSWKHKWWT